jgi:hypothetical protein
LPRHIPRPARKPAPPLPASDLPSTEAAAPDRAAGRTGDRAADRTPLGAAAAPPETGVAGTPRTDATGSAATAALPPPAAPAAPLPRPSELIGLDQQAATDLFGAATEKQEQSPATVWRYRTAECELALYFYLDLRSGRMRTLHYEFKGDSGDPAKRQDCLKSLVDFRRSKSNRADASSPGG